MRPRVIFVTLVLVLLGIFAAANWSLIMASQSLSLVFTRVEAPLGLILLITVALLSVWYVILSIGTEVAALLEVKKYAREILALRKQAEDAEASRLAELKKLIQEELESLRTQLGERIGQSESNIIDELEKAGNTLAAYIGELEDQITGQDRHPPPPPLR
jgi:peptidoglycan hydrolase CwlO-like protein